MKYRICWQFKNGDDKEVRKGSPVEEVLPLGSMTSAIRLLNQTCPNIKHWGEYLKD